MDKKRRIGLAIGKATHTVVEGEKRWYISNCKTGAVSLLKHLKTDKLTELVLCGNRRWATPIAHCLVENGITILYFNIKTEPGKRGKAGNMAELLTRAFQSGITPKSFFQEKRIYKVQSPSEQVLYPMVRMAHEYLDATNTVRKAKHHILDGLALLFPEVVQSKTTSKKVGEDEIVLPIPQPQPPGLFTKKMRPVLANPDPHCFATSSDIPEAVRTLAQHSLGCFVPKGDRRREMVLFRDHLKQYHDGVSIKEARIDSLKEVFQNHPACDDFGNGDLIVVVLAFLNWRKWQNWRELRSYCGLAVSRIDNTGKARISRVRPYIRQYLYLLATLTKRGKEISGKGRRVKRIERLLKYLRHQYLNPIE